MSDATPPPDSICASPTPRETPPPESVCSTPTPESVHNNSTAYYYISSKGRRRYLDTSRLTAYKPLPEGWDESEHYWLYGWPISDRQLQSILPRYFKIPTAGTTPQAEYLDARLAEQILEIFSGYKHLNWFICKPTKDAIMQGIIEDFPPHGPGIPFVTLSCTARRSFFTQRPSVEQLKCLNSMLGEPRWLESQCLKEDFPFDCFA
ncbi:hypothetical protein Agabi119p4_7772 [Agaricus bisporus var. burnettii]|uniref:Uncharacterized protein n=1 Tax=Agaricus bisporus var. burnettii TaxID=192524 RepID=A0A8H7EZ90_AGABI|nr:hypothetical protein Agabi119p4_7772 [Agaricus bisporus var. burnettii]